MAEYTEFIDNAILEIADSNKSISDKRIDLDNLIETVSKALNPGYDRATDTFTKNYELR